MSKLLIDHDQVRAWVAARAGYPAIISIPDGHSGFQTRLRLTFGQRQLHEQGAGNEVIGGVELVPWNEWFDEFEKQQLALRVPASQDDISGSAYQLEKRPET
ncbi:hypothetical protein MNBD_ALPHA12-876 [hydrothermal vent metagenome]|uniref:Uncharacterized protein n=1 Tax=hydrothermal vent metagenome TaxID=652676 RepID=A0A3B0TZ65_9ZZZZ